ncbi:MAG: hypothetical protein ACR2QM_00765 [Longimicrobiales bacterium]
MIRSRVRFALESVEAVIVTVATVLTWPVSKRWLRNWGALAGERDRDWLGDALVSESHSSYTRAISVEAAPEDVWPWLVQFGLGKAGFYSYELLERIAGIPVRNVESIVPRFQTLSVGDEVRLHPKAPGIPVAILGEGRHICFGDLGEEPQHANPEPKRSWSMYLEPGDGHQTRLILRGCIESPPNPSLARRLGGMLEEPVDFIMEQRMLRTLKRLASGAKTAPTIDGGSRVGNTPRPERRV